MSAPIDKLLQHFRDSNRQHIIAAGEAAAAGDFDTLDAVAGRVAGLEVTASITNLVNSSVDDLRAFVTEVEQSFDSGAIRLVFGVVLSGVGGAALAETAGLAAALGISVLSVQVIAIALLLWGLSLSLPALWKRALQKIDETTQISLG